MSGVLCIIASLSHSADQLDSLNVKYSFNTLLGTNTPQIMTKKWIGIESVFGLFTYILRFQG